MDALSAPDRLKLEAARSIREDYLHQDAFHEVDTYTDLHKQYLMMELVLHYYDLSLEALGKGVAIDSLVKLAVRESIGRFKYVSMDKIDAECEAILQNLQVELDQLVKKREEA